MKFEEFTGEVSFFVLKVHMDCSTLTDGAGSIPTNSKRQNMDR